MKRLFQILIILFISTTIIAQSLPPNAVLKNFRPFDTPRTNGRPGEVYRIADDGTKYIVQDITTITHKESDEGDIVGRMYFTAEELLTLLNLEFDRLEVVPVEVKILKAKREYTEQIAVDKVLYESEKIREIIVDTESKYYIIREAILTRDITFRFNHEVVKKIKRGSNALTKVETTEEVDFPFEIRKKFKKEKRVFYKDQDIQIEPYDG
jgi:hypothetical protein